jgi:hypothetical protein
MGGVLAGIEASVIPESVYATGASRFAKPLQEGANGSDLKDHLNLVDDKTQSNSVLGPVLIGQLLDPGATLFDGSMIRLSTFPIEALSHGQTLQLRRRQAELLESLSAGSELA